jgi:hypothetical protein
MGKQRKSWVVGTEGNVTAYLFRGEGYVRSKSSLTANRVKTDPAFQPLMQHAALLKEASRLASMEYKQLPANEKGREKYRQLVGEKMKELKAAGNIDKS